MTNKVTATGVVVAIVIATVALLIALGSVGKPPAGGMFGTASNAVNGGNITNYSAVGADWGFWVGTSTANQIANNVGLFTQSLAQLDGGQLRSYTNSTSTTATSQTLAVADVAAYDTVLITPNVGALTLTFFSSTTAASWLPTAGDMQETCFINSTTTAAATITFAAGVGIDLETASSTRTDLTIGAGNTGCFKFIRQKSTASTFDITAALTEYTDGD